MAIRAKYAGVCPACGQRFVIGVDMIVSNTKGKGWRHEVCPSSSAKKSKDLSNINVPLPVVSDFDGSQLADLFAPTVLDEEKPAKKEFKPTPEQEAIRLFIVEEHGNAVIEAVAGSGKTTTIVWCLDFTPSTSDVGFVAFNKHIVKELKNRVPDHVHVSTLHSLGLDNVKKYLAKFPKIDNDKVGEILGDFWPVSKEALDNGTITKTQRRENFSKRLSMRKLVSICKSTLVDVEDGNKLLEIIERYNIEVEDEYLDEVLEKLPEVMERCKKQVDIIDFDDMIWLPIVLDMKLIQFDFLMVDEAQDMNKVQIDFILKSIKENGRIIAVGDRYQSLYGFRAADTDAIPNIIKAIDAKVLPLSTTFRCPRSHVELAQKLVPHIQARENAPEGVIIQLDYYDLVKKLEPGDMVVCRTNAPLIRPAFECIRQGKKAIIRGKDIGENLINMIKRFETYDLATFEISLMEYFEKEFTRLNNKGKELQAMMLEDNVATLRTVMAECSTVNELMSKIRTLFDDNNIGIIFSSVHRAKGLEAENVFILRPDLMPHPKAKKDWEGQQELNTMYVAQTRSKENLYLVQGGENV